MSKNIFKAYSTNVANWRKSKDFYTPSSLDSTSERDLMLGKLMLVVTEIAEAAEAVRHNNIYNFKEEIADTLIRLFDICGSMDIDIKSEIDNKMEVNETRPIKHDKRCSI